MTSQAQTEILIEETDGEQAYVRPASPDSPMDAEQILQDWSLVLCSMHIPHRIVQHKMGAALSLSRDSAQKAREQIVLFEAENAQFVTDVNAARKGNGSTESVFWIMLALALWHGISQHQIKLFGIDDIQWLQLGRVDGRAMLEQGQWWRALTSLTLHADAKHLLSNIVFGGLFMHLLCQETGGGIAWLLTIAAAGLANALNVLIQGPPHLAIGASTAVFAGLGLLSGMGSPRAKRWPAALAPLGAGLVLLAWLGSGGERTDVGAHLSGFVVGLALIFGLRKSGLERGTLDHLPQNLCGLCAFALILTAWMLAVIV
ncbi:rhomboid family intramembrane serine protease [Desulfovermiculus halophilus]|jgi:membrane associated rhomboid family serine protease|uniref:rhomboid family intramembrane serine protease n=1 Tax=Desulfovermiculus halophilus TaxID=339722 RepID=UPI00068489E1|nr:rhomboid family intramembrane serine protease [Desulfovermiculus halophilus]